MTITIHSIMSPGILEEDIYSAILENLDKPLHLYSISFLEKDKCTIICPMLPDGRVFTLFNSNGANFTLGDLDALSKMHTI